MRKFLSRNRLFDGSGAAVVDHGSADPTDAMPGMVRGATGTTAPPWP